MKYAQVKDGKVVNVIKCDESSPLDLLAQGFDHFVRVDLLETLPDIGYDYDGENFTAPEVEEVFADITPRQIRLALLLSGVSLEDIETALNSLDEPVKSVALIEWQYAIAFERKNDLVNQVGTMLGWNTEQIDNLWRQAITL